MEIINVKIPDKGEFNICYYTPEYNGIIIALDKDNKPIGYIIYEIYNNEYILTLNKNNCIYGIFQYSSFEELFDCNSEIKYLKLIKFNKWKSI